MDQQTPDRPAPRRSVVPIVIAAVVAVAVVIAVVAVVVNRGGDDTSTAAARRPSSANALGPALRRVGGSAGTTTTTRSGATTTTTRRASSPSPSPTASPSPGGDKLVVRDDFSNAKSGFPVSEDEDTKRDYVDGEYQILIKTAGYSLISATKQNRLLSTVAEVDVRRSGTAYGAYGIMCRWAGWDKPYYEIVIDPEGNWGIGRASEEDGYASLNNGEADPALLTGDAVNRITVSCVGTEGGETTITLSANGTVIGDGVDTAGLAPGRVGMFAGSYEEAGVDIRFDNLVISRA